MYHVIIKILWLVTNINIWANVSPLHYTNNSNIFCGTLKGYIHFLSLPRGHFQTLDNYLSLMDWNWLEISSVVTLTFEVSSDW